MDSRAFKSLFSQIAAENGFDPEFGGWFRESEECVVVLDLQKSNFGNYYELNLKIFVQGLFGDHHVRSKDVVKKKAGDVFVRQPNQFRSQLALDSGLSPLEYERGLQMLFADFVRPVTSDALTRAGLLRLGHKGVVYLLPAVREQLTSNPWG
jgi:hypothetical protein